MQDYYDAIKNAQAHFIDLYDVHHDHPALPMDPDDQKFMQTFYRWMSIYFGLIVEYRPYETADDVSMIHRVRDPEKAIMFKLRF